VYHNVQSELCTEERNFPQAIRSVQHLSTHNQSIATPSTLPETISNVRTDNGPDRTQKSVTKDTHVTICLLQMPI